MSSDRAFRIPRAHKDRVQPRQLVAIAATCMSVGVALSGVLKATHREHANGWQGAHMAIEVPALQSVIETSISAATEAIADPTPPPAREGSPPSASMVAAKKPGKAKVTLTRGDVTYRCDVAVRSAEHAGACPHDPALEARVWRVLARLASCRGTADALGHADLKLWFGPGATTRLVFAASTISPSLNLRAVSQCVARDLSKLHATHNTDRFELNLSFALSARE